MPFQGNFDWLFGQDTTIAVVVFALVVLAMAAAIVLSHIRRRRGRPPSERAEANTLELGYVAVLAGIVVFIVTTSFIANARDFPDPPKPSVVVSVTAYQWCWKFQYPGHAKTVTGQCEGGALPTLVVPAGETVRVEMTSADVIHAFWVPYFKLKMYAYPGETNTFVFTAPHPGRWIGRCAQLCGLYHYGMDFYVQAESVASFSKFIGS